MTRSVMRDDVLKKKCNKRGGEIAKSLWDKQPWDFMARVVAYFFVALATLAIYAAYRLL